MNQEELYNLISAINNVLSPPQKDEEKLFSELSVLLTNSFGNKLYFCKIQGRRWAFLAGDDQMLTPENQLQLTPQYGILYNTPGDEASWNVVIDFLQKQLR